MRPRHGPGRQRIGAAAAILVMVVGSGGCAGAPLAPTGIHAVADDVQAVDLTADRRLVLAVQGANGRSWVCSEPPPEAAATAKGGLSLGIAGDSVDDESQVGQTSFGGGLDRTVRLTEELLFRACELSMNIGATPDQAQALFERALEVIERAVGGGVDAAGGEPPPTPPS